jgi:hypothetical protein
MKRRVPTIWIRLRKQRRIGRPRGARSAIPNSVKASVKAVIEEVVSERSPSIKAAIIDGLESGPRNADRYLRMCAEYTDGKPDATLNLRTQFKEDELSIAQRDLARKFETLFARATRVQLLPAKDEDDEEHLARG